MTSFLGPGSPLRSVAVAGVPAGVEHPPLGEGVGHSSQRAVSSAVLSALRSPPFYFGLEKRRPLRRCLSRLFKKNFLSNVAVEIAHALNLCRFGRAGELLSNVTPARPK